MRVIAARFNSFAAFGRILGMHCAPLAFCVLMFSDKCLKKWYHLPTNAFDRQGSAGRPGVPPACLTGERSDNCTAKVCLRPVIGGDRKSASQIHPRGMMDF